MPKNIDISSFSKKRRGKFRLDRSYCGEITKKPVVAGFFAQNVWLVAVYNAGAVRAYSKARACSSVGSAIR
jgi:hypothetical protein